MCEKRGRNLRVERYTRYEQKRGDTSAISFLVSETLDCLDPSLGPKGRITYWNSFKKLKRLQSKGVDIYNLIIREYSNNILIEHISNYLVTSMS